MQAAQLQLALDHEQVQEGILSRVQLCLPGTGKQVGGEIAAVAQVAAEAEARRRGRERGNVQRLVYVQLARLPVRAQRP